ncbi:hypothetical protein [Actomonas aquatica]|uniref:Gingipain domain-containing protein n=1 Tax=Actomonas aquatica TaxID=2866162 RepID=A0ABZ1C464_9BACT|nr:hypothetical protein [Opitutus sp. WL0086]WRQ86165.1 hypothetical protein K1X11_015225 [Opitutus sp. WL0086]
MPTKIIVSHRAALQAKYAAGLTRIDTALQTLIQADARRHLSTQIIYLDDPTSMTAVGGRPVSIPATERQTKAAIDAIYAHHAPDYLLILGAPDVLPHQQLHNPLYRPRRSPDPDQFVPSDLPYACNTSYAQDITQFVGPSRVVGRLPDVTGSHDARAFAALIKRQSRWTSQPAKAYDQPFGLTAQIWQASTQLSLSNAFGSPARPHQSPPAGPNWTPPQLRPKSHFINCHGAPSDPRFYGESPSHAMPVAHDASLLAGHITRGTVTAAECCYGAELFDPTTSALGTLPLCQTYLQEGAYGYLGSSTIAYGPRQGNALADLICISFFQALRAGASLGRSTLEARTQFVAGSAALSPFELKTLAQFNLLGDPSIHPVKRPADATLTEDPNFATKSRRYLAHQQGLTLQKTQAVAGALDDTTPSPRLLKKVRAIFHAKPPRLLRVLTYPIREPGSTLAKARGVAHALRTAPPRAFHIAFEPSPHPEAGRPLQLSAVLAIEDAAGEIVAVQHLCSR